MAWKTRGWPPGFAFSGPGGPYGLSLYFFGRPRHRPQIGLSVRVEMGGLAWVFSYDLERWISWVGETVFGFGWSARVVGASGDTSPIRRMRVRNWSLVAIGRYDERQLFGLVAGPARHCPFRGSVDRWVRATESYGLSAWAHRN